MFCSVRKQSEMDREPNYRFCKKSLKLQGQVQRDQQRFDRRQDLKGIYPVFIAIKGGIGLHDVYLMAKCCLFS